MQGDRNHNKEVHHHLYISDRSQHVRLLNPFLLLLLRLLRSRYLAGCSPHTESEVEGRREGGRREGGEEGGREGGREGGEREGRRVGGRKGGSE